MEVEGSESQKKAETPEIIVTMQRTILHLKQFGCKQARTSVNRRSNAFKSKNNFKKIEKMKYLNLSATNLHKSMVPKTLCKGMRTMSARKID